MRTIVKEKYNIKNSATNELIEYQYGIKLMDGDVVEFKVDIPPSDVDRGNDVILTRLQDHTNQNGGGWLTMEEFEQLETTEWVDIDVMRVVHVHGDPEQEDYAS